MVLNLFTLCHVLISLVAILAGFVVVFGMIGGRPLAGWTALFLTTTVATSVTGFLFPFHRFMPSHAVGILSLVVLGAAIYARYSRQLAGGWRRTYAITAVIALYFNFFVLVAQLFQKVPALNVLAPKGTEPPFAITQAVVMIIFVGLGIAAARNFRNPVPF
jgi:hypothetical protein